MDSFGYFVNKAKTRVYRDTTEPNWNEVGLVFLDVTCFPCAKHQCMMGRRPELPMEEVAACSALELHMLLLRKHFSARFIWLSGLAEDFFWD